MNHHRNMYLTNITISESVETHTCMSQLVILSMHDLVIQTYVKILIVILPSHSDSAVRFKNMPSRFTGIACDYRGVESGTDNWIYWTQLLLSFSVAPWQIPRVCSSLHTHWVLSVCYLFTSPLVLACNGRSSLSSGFENCPRATATATLYSQCNH
jgi:hypothetical protein